MFGPKTASIRSWQLRGTLPDAIRHLSSSKNAGNSAGYCMENVRKFDYENFLATLLLKAESRRTAFAIRAFNVEVSRIAQVTSDDKIAAMRLKFWEEAIEKIFKSSGPVPDHPVANELRAVVASRRMSQKLFQALVLSRNRPRNQGFLTLRQLEDYCEHTTASVYCLLLETRGIKELKSDSLCSSLGKAQGIANILRSIPQMQRTQGVPIPQEILMRHGVSQERILRQKPEDKGVEECIFEVATAAHQHLERARGLVDEIPRDAKPFLLPGVAVGRYLERLRQANFNLTHQSLLRRDSSLPLVYAWNKFRGKF